MTRAARANDPTTRRPPSLLALQVVAALSVLNLTWQFVTAGQLFPRGGPEELHSWGAIVLHVLTGLTTLAAAWHWRTAHEPLWPAVSAPPSTSTCRARSC